MFYCNPCGLAAEWPTDIFFLRSHGRCEVCGEVADCYDIPSSALPIPSPDFTARRHAGEHEIKEEP